MAKVFGESFPGQAAEKSHAHVFEGGFEPGDAPPVDFTNFPDTKPVDPETEPPCDPETGLPVILPDQASGHTPFDDADAFPENVPDFLDFF